MVVTPALASAEDDVVVDRNVGLGQLVLRAHDRAHRVDFCLGAEDAEVEGAGEKPVVRR